jgi:DNA adenine methylase
MGGGAVFSRTAPSFKCVVGADISIDLMVMWGQLRDGWVPQETLTESEYRQLKTAEPSALRGLAGFGASFGGMWFSGYARGGFNANGSPRNHYGESRRTAMKDALSMFNSSLVISSYDSWMPDETFVVYCDPPYAGTKTYKAAKFFDTTMFWHTMNEWSDNGAQVFVSEYKAPVEWECCFEATITRQTTKPIGGRPLRSERLWVRK